MEREIRTLDTQINSIDRKLRPGIFPTTRENLELKRTGLASQREALSQRLAELQSSEKQ